MFLRQTAARVIALALVVSAAAGCRSRPSSEPLSLAAATPRFGDAQRLHADVAWLAADQRAGRRAGTSGGLEAGAWIAERCADMGLEPAGSLGFFQDFAVPLEPKSGGRSSLGRDDGSALVEEPSGELAPLFCAEGGTALGRAVWCGYGIDADELGWNDFEGKDLRGAVAILVRGAPELPAAAKPADKSGSAQPSSPHGDTNVSAGGGLASQGLLFTKVMNAKRRGALGVVIVQHPTKQEPLLPFGQGGSARAGIPCALLSVAGAERVLGAWFSEAALALDARDSTGSPRDSRQLAPASAPRVQLVADVQRGQGPAKNVLARLPGADRSRAIVIGAHYDHLGHGGHGALDPKSLGQVHNGADDNASGTAAVLEVARLMKQGPKPACDIVFALWSGEELGLLGSEHWAQQPSFALANVVANINLDMVGRAGNGQLQVLAAGTAAPFEAWMPSAAKNAGLELAVNASGNAIAGSSDHATFIKRKIPALHLFSGLHQDYHKPSDDLERFEAQGTAKVVALTIDFAERIAASGRSELAFVEQKEATGERKLMAGGGFRAWFGSIPNYAYSGKGVLIDGTSPGSPAEHSGFLRGDVLLAIGDVAIDTIYDFTYSLQLYKPGDVVLVKYTRDGAAQESRVTLGTRGAQ